MGIKGTMGNKRRLHFNLDLEVSMHQSMSVGANVDGIIKLGATHEKEVKEAYILQEEKALKS